ncbi:iron-containing alcohol dehydrogenase [Paucibacter sp. Y2R2-4]|uniref:iron-containing alcohol dehydrogenase n=1 Tax=Paucibacter sp. Y2R2-4 TaxID=2893553 RepID=UPI0021E39914|nr:iron-containing alcohol dehydrogenase [Paucibacter sp. Y2R2-4]MCV2348266.1 iron-containing alcohol dehydrogenase [Paucibacter sp. Y2R2-4]
MALIQYLTQIHFDFGAVSQLPQICAQAGILRPLVVTDAGIRAAGVLTQALSAWGEEAPPVFDQTPANPTEAAVRWAVKLLHMGHCDGLVAIGGGSSMDLAKGVALAAHHEGPLSQLATIEGGSARIGAKLLPVIAVPTTAGTGSEVARGALLIVDDGRKLGFHHWALLPKAAICDPDLTLGLPPGLSAATGMDAIAHCMETFMSNAVNPPADGIALEGLRRGWAHLERVVRDGRDREARWQMMSCSMQGALAFQKGLGCVHSLSHALGGVDPRLHHGTLNAVLLPAVIRFNAKAPGMLREQKLARMAQAMGLPGCDGLGTQIAEAITQMNERIGLPAGLAAMDVDPAVFDRVIEGAMKDHCHASNPRQAQALDYLEMLHASL